jgi:hypothetical protein
MRLAKDSNVTLLLAAEVPLQLRRHRRIQDDWTHPLLPRW